MTHRYDRLIRQHFEVVMVRGDEYICKCKFHQDGGKPNLYVNGTKGLFICFACGAKGTLASQGQPDPPSKLELREKLAKVDTPGPQPLSDLWLKQFDLPHPKYQARHLSDEVIRMFQLGYDPFEDELTIPLRTWRGHLLGVIRRRTDDQRPSYRYPKGIPIGKHLFGAWKIRQRHRKVALVEGSLDAVACWDARVPSVALLGARLTDDQTRVLLRLGVPHVVVMTDADKAGQEAVDQIHSQLKDTGIAMSVGVYRPYWVGCKDPGDLARKPERIRKMFHSAMTWPAWLDQK
jgi:DNA primase